MQELSLTPLGLSRRGEITVDRLASSYSLAVLEGVGVSADPAAQGKLLPRWWVNHVQGALRSLQLFTLWPCEQRD